MIDTDQDPPPPVDETLSTEVWQLEAQLPQLRAGDQHDLAAALGERLLEIREATLGPAHVKTLEALESLAESYFQISRYERACALFERALLAREADAATTPIALGHILAQLAKVVRVMGDLDRSEALYRRALSVYKEAPERAFVGVAAAFHGLSSLCDSRGQLDEAEAMCRAALEMREKIFGENGLQVAESLNSLAILLRKKGDLAEAERMYLRANTIHEIKKGYNHPGVVPTLINLGILYLEKKEHAKAGKVLTRALSILETRGGPADALMASVLDALSSHHEAAGDAARSLELARRSLAICEELYGPVHVNVAGALNNLGVKLVAAEETREEAEALFCRALEIGGENPTETTFGSTLINLAMMRLAKEDFDSAEALATRAHTMAREHLGPDHLDTAQALFTLSLIAEQRGNIERALELMLGAFTIRAKAPMLDQSIDDMTRMGALMLAADEPAEAVKSLKDALSLAEKSRGKDHPSTARLMFLLGKAALAQKHWKRVIFCVDSARKIEEKAKGRTHTDLVELFQLSADADLALGKFAAAEVAYRRIGEIDKANYPAESEWQAIPLALLGEVATKRKAFDKAAELFEQALAISERVFGKDSFQLLTLLDKVGEAQFQAGATARTEELSLRLLAMLERELPPDDSRLLPSLRRLATVYMKTKHERTAELVKRSMVCLETLIRETQAETAQINADLARRKGQS
jgi:tetratricopeptide (TPR) repeat protein